MFFQNVKPTKTRNQKEITKAQIKILQYCKSLKSNSLGLVFFGDPFFSNISLASTSFLVLRIVMAATSIVTHLVALVAFYLGHINLILGLLTSWSAPSCERQSMHSKPFLLCCWILRKFSFLLGWKHFTIVQRWELLSNC